MRARPKYGERALGRIVKDILAMVSDLRAQMDDFDVQDVYENDIQLDCT